MEFLALDSARAIAGAGNTSTTNLQLGSQSVEDKAIDLEMPPGRREGQERVPVHGCVRDVERAQPRRLQQHAREAFQRHLARARGLLRSSPRTAHRLRVCFGVSDRPLAFEISCGSRVRSIQIPMQVSTACP